MEAFTRETMGVAMEGDGLEIRMEEAGEMTVALFRLPGGTDMRPLLQGLEGDVCQCPHWGYMLKGTVRMHTPSGPKDYEAGKRSIGRQDTRPKRWRMWSMWTSHPPKS